MSVSLGLSPTPSSSLSQPLVNIKPPSSFPSLSKVRVCRRGVCRASQAVDLFPPLSPEIVVRDARLEDCWEVADTHCSSFFPDYTFPVDVALRIDRFVALLSGFSVPPGCMRTCLVAVTCCALTKNLFIGNEDFKVGGFEGKFSFNKGSVSGILTVDTIADFLPRKGPFRQRRTGVAYISNVAVRESERRKGVGKLLIAKAEAKARSWGCRSVALHCDANNLAAVRLYKGQGYRIIRVPEQAKWPQPKTAPNVEFDLMMKLLSPSITSPGSA
ncbi:uncharacterized protein M6B38_383265 [Iris pallida]|uniref:N-acetyltransferase domain-containing protein n=1 Tax=Iris pallida TaxID=29817 RepID=A0AAX6G416_IRIPA|nr:Uncharacterized protein M6B38_238055 [Iris pallida]KAJ6823474.1 uncharacterized protein M6B38_383265 [Iris pallida]